MVGVLPDLFLANPLESNVVSEKGAKGLRELIPTAKLIDVTGAGHTVAGDDNVVFSGGLKGFLDEDVVAVRH